MEFLTLEVSHYLNCHFRHHEYFQFDSLVMSTRRISFTFEGVDVL